MLLAPHEAGLFFRLHRTLMFHVNEQIRVLPGDLTSPEDFAALPSEERVKVGEAILENPDLLESFISRNPADLSDEELAIVSSWRHQIAGKFYVFRQLKKYTIFLSSTDPPVAYGVTALTQPFDELVGPWLPVLVETVLMPFGDKIVYDSILRVYTVSFGSGIRRGLNESYREAKDYMGIVTSLTAGGARPGRKVREAK